MPLLEFETCRQRIERAKTHSAAFAEVWNGLIKDDLYRSILHIEDDGAGRLWMEPRYESLPASLSLELGEFLYQLRGALDACVYGAAILETGQDPPPDERKLEFPICESAEDFQKASWKLGPLTEKRRHIIESIQPYNAVPDMRPEIRVFSAHRTLEFLNDWARKDRHRKLHVVGSWASNADPKFLLPPGVTLGWMMVTYDGLLEHNSEITAFKLDGFTRGADVKVNPDVFIDVAVAEPQEPCADNDTLSERTSAMLIWVKAVVDEIERSFLDERKARASSEPWSSA